MNKLQFSIDIKAPKEDVWKTLWTDSTYRKWTGAFNTGSHAESDWKEGSKILFLDSNDNGMSSVIDKMVPNEFMSFKHMGEVKNKKEVPNDEKSKLWSGAKENYTLKQKGEITTLSVDMDVTEEYDQMFRDIFPKALQQVKEISEKSEALHERV
jgi:uncharacterized protein YndB with AHSA1/START domain